MIGPAIALRDVGVVLGGGRVLFIPALDLGGGRVHAVVGPNGGGKTTLVRALLGQMPFEGRITLEAEGRVVVGYVPQSLDIDRTLPLTVLDVMAVMNQRRPAFLGCSRLSRGELDAALAAMGMAGRGRRLFGALSGGERQRVLFAQACVPRPDLLVMDEPTASMDGEGEALVEAAVRDLVVGGATVVWVSHDGDQVRRTADTVTMINRRLLAHGAPRDVLLPETVRASA
jgi:zinc transport system ATP-binding protein